MQRAVRYLKRRGGDGPDGECNEREVKQRRQMQRRGYVRMQSHPPGCPKTRSYQEETVPQFPLREPRARNEFAQRKRRACRNPPVLCSPVITVRSAAQRNKVGEWHRPVLEQCLYNSVIKI